ncbi:PAS domain S-box protein [Methylobacterium sp. Leaf117]|uniref:PAS domain S-box protein n=1 Tax=Methylobacterium sp. Leaf117 TaxID=1736260 RepID=UPI0006F5F849|nr:PAS domain S-box protein [Methylobacterium sp. Leaf117]KQP91695.1 hypothetical protein ASF57_03995 [Methylobacterium sp. Leaf117]
MVFGSHARISKLNALDDSQALIAFDLDGKVVTANKTFLDALGYRLAEIRGRHHSMSVGPAEREGDDDRLFWEALAAASSRRPRTSVSAMGAGGLD